MKEEKEDVSAEDVNNSENELAIQRNENTKLTYQNRMRGLEIKLKTMELLYEQLELLAKESKGLEGNERHDVVRIMAAIGQAICPEH